MGSLEEWSRTDLSSIRTGDVLFFSNNTPTGLTLRTFTSTLWNHTGIAVRLIQRKDRRPKISLTTEGELCVMEINSRTRYDAYTQTRKKGFGLTQIEYILQTQILGAVRHMKQKYRHPELPGYTHDFISDYKDSVFSKSFKPLLNVWLGYPFSGVGYRNAEEGLELFCSEMMAYYYVSCVLPLVKIVEGDRLQVDSNNPFKAILGEESPSTPEMIAPRHFDVQYTPNALIFENSIKLIHRRVDSTRKVLLAPVLVTLFVAVLIWLLLPGNDWASVQRSTTTSKAVKPSTVKVS